MSQMFERTNHAERQTMSFEYDDQDLLGEGMPRGNKAAGFIGLMVAKAKKPKGLQRTEADYPNNPEARKKNTPAELEIAKIRKPSRYIQERWGKKGKKEKEAKEPKEKVGRKKKSVVEKSAKGRFTKEERDELKRLADEGNADAKKKLEEIQQAERARKGKQLGREVKKREPKKEKKTQADEFAEAEARRKAQPVEELDEEEEEVGEEFYDEDKAEEAKLRDLELINRRLSSLGRKTIPKNDWLAVKKRDKKARYDAFDKKDILNQALEWAQNATEDAVETVTIPTIAGRQQGEAQTRRQRDDLRERLRVNAFRSAIGQPEFDAGQWERLDDEEKDELIGYADAMGIRGRGKKKGGQLVKSSVETDAQFEARKQRVAEKEAKLATLPIVPYNEYWASNTTASKALRTHPLQLNVDKLGQALTTLAYYKDPQIAKAFDEAKKKIDDPFNKILRTLKSVADVGVALADFLPLPFAGKVIKTLYENVGAPAVEGAFAQDDAFKAKYEAKDAERQKYLAAGAKLLPAYAEAKKKLEEHKVDLYNAYVQEQTKRGGAKPPNRQMVELTKTSYETTPPLNVADFQLVVNTPTVDAYVNEDRKEVVITVRGTVPTDKKDLVADANIPLNRLSKTDRYKTDQAVVGQIIDRYPTHSLYLAGHSLGGAVINQLTRDVPMLKDASTYNPAFQPYDFLRQQSDQIARFYTNTDPLYRLGGRFFQNVKVVPPKTTMSSLGSVGKLYEALKGHQLENFEGAGKVKGKTITMPIGEFKAEHKRLIKALTPAAKELAEQKDEVKKYGLGKPMLKLYKDGKVYRGAYHIMKDGSVHTGKTHTKSSKPLSVKE